MGLEVTEDRPVTSTTNSPARPRLLNRGSDIHVDHVVYGNRAVKVERENSGFHDSERRHFPASVRMYRTRAQRSFSGRCRHGGMGPRPVVIFQRISPSGSS